MIELGIALYHFENNNIILLLNEHIRKNVLSKLSGFEVTYYNSDYYLDICDKINSNIDNLYEKILIIYYQVILLYFYKI